jgi:hypothetical protein
LKSTIYLKGITTIHSVNSKLRVSDQGSLSFISVQCFRLPAWDLVLQGVHRRQQQFDAAIEMARDGIIVGNAWTTRAETDGNDPLRR